MENIILLMLFTYPGAIAYLVYVRATCRTTYYREYEPFSRTALCFFISAAVTVISCGILSMQAQSKSLETLIGKIKTSDMLWAYLMTSLCASIATGLLWSLLAWIEFRIANRRKEKKGLPIKGKPRKVWAHLVNEYEVTQCIAIIRKGGKIVRAGVPQILPDDLDTEPMVCLSYCNRVEKELAKPDWGLLGNRFMSVYRLDTDSEIEFVAAEELFGAMRNEEIKADEPIYPLSAASADSAASV